MGDAVKLQKAINLTMSEGYQLSREAFQFLSTVASTEDPIEIMGRALNRIADLESKPLLIDRGFLEQLVKESEPVKEILASEQDGFEGSQIQSNLSTQTTEAKSPFRSFAKEVETDLKVVEDAGAKLSSDGTIEDYIGYFRDRYKRTEKLLRQRLDVKSAASIIDALKAPPNTRLKIIGMVTERRESKKRTIITLEDLQTNITVLVPQNASQDLHRKAQCLLLDQVVCASVVKSRTSLVIAEDIILPEVGQKIQRRASVPVYAALTSDMHVGSAKFQRDAFNRFVLWLNGKYGDERLRETASHVKYVLIAGDIVDGVGVYPNQLKELAVKDINKQYRLAAKYLEQIPDYIEIVIIPGNHDAPRKALPQPPITSTFLETLQESRNVHSLGNPCTLSLHGIEILIYHGRSLDDVNSTVPEMNYNNPEKAMKLLLQSRHLAPLYGGKTPLSPENRDFLVIERVPDIFHAGHVHSLGYMNYRGVLIVNSGCWQEQTDYMKNLGLVPAPSKVPVVNLQTMETTVISFK